MHPTELQLGASVKTSAVTRYWRRSPAQSSCSSSRGPFGLFSRWITVLGALRCTPGSVANPLNRLGRFIAAFESGPVVIRQGVKPKSGGRGPFAVAVCRYDKPNISTLILCVNKDAYNFFMQAIKSPLNGGLFYESQYSRQPILTEPSSRCSILMPAVSLMS